MNINDFLKKYGTSGPSALITDAGHTLGGAFKDQLLALSQDLKDMLVTENTPVNLRLPTYAPLQINRVKMPGDVGLDFFGKDNLLHAVKFLRDSIKPRIARNGYKELAGLISTKDFIEAARITTQYIPVSLLVLGEDVESFMYLARLQQFTTSLEE